MSKKPKPAPTQPQPKTPSKRAYFGGRDGLGAYTADPTAFGPERMVYHNDNVAVIFDLYPKASIHTLVLARDPSKQLLHPFDAFEDPSFLSMMKSEVEKTELLVASELRRRYGRFSADERPRIGAMKLEDPPDDLPNGKDWSKHVMSGVHADPSMNHLHVHVMARDMVSDAMRHRKHYETFNTAFLVPLEAFPLAKDDPRRCPESSGILNQDMVCWRCGRNFGNRFTQLKAHLDEEFEKWKAV